MSRKHSSPMPFPPQNSSNQPMTGPSSILGYNEASLPLHHNQQALSSDQLGHYQALLQCGLVPMDAMQIIQSSSNSTTSGGTATRGDVEPAQQSGMTVLQYVDPDLYEIDRAHITTARPIDVPMSSQHPYLPPGSGFPEQFFTGLVRHPQPAPPVLTVGYPAHPYISSGYQLGHAPSLDRTNNFASAPGTIRSISSIASFASESSFASAESEESVASFPSMNRHDYPAGATRSCASWPWPQVDSPPSAQPMLPRLPEYIVLPQTGLNNAVNSAVPHTEFGHRHIAPPPPVSLACQPNLQGGPYEQNRSFVALDQILEVRHEQLCGEDLVELWSDAESGSISSVDSDDEHPTQTHQILLRPAVDPPQAFSPPPPMPPMHTPSSAGCKVTRLTAMSPAADPTSSESLGALPVAEPESTQTKLSAGPEVEADPLHTRTSPDNVHPGSAVPAPNRLRRACHRGHQPDHATFEFVEAEQTIPLPALTAEEKVTTANGGREKKQLTHMEKFLVLLLAGECTDVLRWNKVGDQVKILDVRQFFKQVKPDGQLFHTSKASSLVKQFNNYRVDTQIIDRPGSRGKKKRDIQSIIFSHPSLRRDNSSLWLQVRLLPFYVANYLPVMSISGDVSIAHRPTKAVVKKQTTSKPPKMARRTLQPMTISKVVRKSELRVQLFKEIARREEWEAKVQELKTEMERLRQETSGLKFQKEGQAGAQGEASSSSSSSGVGVGGVGGVVDVAECSGPELGRKQEESETRFAKQGKRKSATQLGATLGKKRSRQF